MRNTVLLACCLVFAGCDIQATPTGPTGPSASTANRVLLRADPPVVFTGGATVTLTASVDPPLAGVPVTFTADHVDAQVQQAVTDARGEAVVQVTTASAFTVSADTPGAPRRSVSVPVRDPFAVSISNDRGSFAHEQVIYLPVPAINGTPVRWPIVEATATIAAAVVGVRPVRVTMSCGGTLPETSAPVERGSLVGSFPIQCRYQAPGRWEVSVTADNGHVARNSFHVTAIQ